MLLGGPSGGNPRSDVQDDPAFRTLRGTLELPHDAARRLHDRAQPRPVREDRRLPARRRARARDRQRLDRRPAPRARRPRDHADRRPPRSDDVPAARRPTSCRSASRRASRTACPRCARRCATRSSTARALIKISASGGVMSHSGLAGAQQYSDEELAAIVDEAHRAGPQGRRARARRRRHPGVHPRRRRLHRARLARERRHHPDDGRARHVPRPDELPVGRARRLARRARAAGEGGRGVPAGAGDARARRSRPA